ncbi:MAG: peptide ABC transporter substrate-binding protein [Chloroflexota bacterium]|nr:peptide ABC transporter substrate-binding protein [Chloroflexota bacterium]
MSSIPTLDPALVMPSDMVSLNALQLIYTGLVTLDDKLQPRGELAQSWDVSSDGLSLTFHLRLHLTFSDGTPLTSSDIAYSIDRALQPITKSPEAPIYLEPIRDSDKLLAGYVSSLLHTSLLTPDENTLIILLKRPSPSFLSMLTYPCSYVVEKHLLQTYPTNLPEHLMEGGTTGPFKVAQYLPGKEIDFVPNSHYAGPQPQLQKIVFPFYTAEASAYNDYQRGKVDTTPVPLATFTNDRKRTDFHQVPQLWINYYTMNYLVPPFNNISIRQAFALAINKTEIANTVWKGTVYPTNHIMPEGMPGYNPNLTGPDGTKNLTGNAKRAQALLQQGLREEKLADVAQLPAIKLSYATGMSGTAQEVTAMIGLWQKVLGITVIPDPLAANTLLDQVTLATGNAQGLQFWGMSWIAEYPDAQDWLTRQFDRGVANNNMNYGQNSSSDVTQQVNVQKVLEAADANPDAGSRIKNYQQAEQSLINAVAWLPVEQVTSTFLRKPTVVGIVDTAEGLIPPDDWANIYIGEAP